MKIAVVTGGLSGIGRAVVEKLRQNPDIHVISISRRVCIESMHNFEHIQSGIDDINKIIDALGNRKISYLINNAGIIRDNLFIRMKDEEIDDVIQTNLVNTMKLTRTLIKHFDYTRQSRIVNVSSVVGLTGNIGQANYSAAKAGIIGFTKSLALELARKETTVNAVAPGYVETDMTLSVGGGLREKIVSLVPLKRLGSVYDIVNAIMFLLSDESSYITGNTLHINGGMYMN